MSGLEVIGGISAVIAIIDGLVKVWNCGKKDIKLGKSFDKVANQLPILQDTFQTYQTHFESVKTTIPADAAQALLKTIESCEGKAQKLHTIVEETIAGGDDNWYERYRKVARRLGKGSQVEELMKSITEDAQNLVNHHIVKSVGQDLSRKLDEIIVEMKSVEPSLPSDDVASQTFNAYGGPQNVSTGSSTQYNSSNTGSGDTHNYGGITGNPTFNFGTVFSGRITSVRSYAHSSLHPVTTYVHRPELERQLQQQLLPGHDAEGRSEMQASATIPRHFLGGGWTEGTIERDYIQIYKQLYPDKADGSTTIPVEDAITSIKNWLQQQQHRYLWVMDSADAVEDDDSDDYIDLDHYLPETPQLDRIITTRSSQAQNMSSLESVIVAELDAIEAAELFKKCAKLKKTGEEVDQEVTAIVKELGFLALAITLAGSYVSETPRLSSNLKLYLPEYQAHRQRLLSRKARKNIHRYSDSVLGTWEMSFKRVERRSPTAARLLTFLAFLNFDDISIRLFEVARPPPASHQSGDQEQHRWVDFLLDKETGIDQYTIEEGFATLQAYSLVSWREEQEAYAMHKLVHAWSHDRLGSVQRQQYSLAALELLRCVANSNKGDLSMDTQMVPHVMANFTAISAACGSTYRFEVWNRDAMEVLVGVLHRLGRWDDAHKLCTTLCHATEQVFGKEDPSTLTSMRCLTSILIEQGKYAQAAEIAHQCLVSVKNVQPGGEEYKDAMISMHQIALILAHQGKYQQAEEMQQKLVNISEMVLGPEHTQTLRSKGNLAYVMLQQGKLTQAYAIYHRTWEVMTRVSEEDDPAILTCVHDLAAVVLRLGKLEEAEQSLRLVLELRRRVNGENHSDTLAAMGNLGLVLFEQGKHKQAEDTQRHVLKLQQRVLGTDHPFTLTTMGNLTRSLIAQDRNDEAERLSRQALDSTPQVHGSEHFETSLIMATHAMVLQSQEKYEEAERINRQALDMRRRLQCLELPETLPIMDNHAICLKELGRFEEAGELALETLNLREQILGVEHPDTLPSMRILGGILLNLNDYKTAEVMNRCALQVAEELQRQEEPNTILIMNNLSLAIARQKRYEEAIELLEQTSDLAIRVLGQEDPLTPQLANNLITMREEYQQAQQSE